VIVRISPAVREIPRVAKIAVDNPEVIECHRITGEDCFLLKLCLRAIGELAGILDLFTPFGRTTTSVVQSSPVARRPLPLSRP
jgi:Lrp/AsnC family leucine-responsive transcriptional regulator